MKRAKKAKTCESHSGFVEESTPSHELGKETSTTKKARKLMWVGLDMAA